MRRLDRGTRCGARGFVHVSEHSGGIGAPPGTTRSPCQELAEGSADAFARADRTKAGPVAGMRTPQMNMRCRLMRYRPLAYLSAWT